MWPDNETDRDLLNFEGVADTVAQIIYQADGRAISVGISGAWGVGKSSMIRLVKASLGNERSPYAREGTGVIFVEFNAWLYQGYDDARAALLDVIAVALLEEATARERAIDKVTALAKRVRWLRVARHVVLPVVAQGMATFAGAPPPDPLAVIGDGLATAPTLIDPEPDKSPPQEIQALRASFEEALAELDLTLVVLIDDLDRCLPATTISTLEAIRLFLFLDRTAFVIAADDDMIKHAVSVHFGGLSNEDLVTNYFDKLIQVPVKVPSLGTHEVRAYMMMLFIDGSAMEQNEKDAVRAAVAAQLRVSWQGKRVDRAFIQSLDVSLPPDLVARLDVAERLAPIMATASDISGNPRLIKRFLNALWVRMSIASAQGVAVDEAVLVKLLLFERLAPPALYLELATAVGASPDGKAEFLEIWERSAIVGDEPELDGAWDHPFMREWLGLSPQLAGIDLRGALYVCRDQAPVATLEDRLSSEAAQLLAALLEFPGEAGGLRAQLVSLSRADLAIVMDRLLASARSEQSWGVPPILDACLIVAEIDPSSAARLAGFLIDRPAAQIAPNIVPKIAELTWATPVLEHWNASAVAGPVKKVIATRGRNGDIAK